MSDDFNLDGIDDAVEFRKWEYEEGDVLAGEVVSVFDGDGEHGPYTCFVIKTRDEPASTEGGKVLDADTVLSRFCSHGSAGYRDVPKDVKVGDRLAMKFVEAVPAKKKGYSPFQKFGYKHFPVAPAAATADW